MSSSPALTRAEADRLLKQFHCLTSPGRATASSATAGRATNEENEQAAQDDRLRLQQALKQVAAASDYQMLGICADSIEQGRAALVSYAAALGYQPSLELEPIEGPIYIKFNSRAMSCYASPYEGEHRGVLVSCQSADEDGVNEMYGHLPIDLFAN